MKTNYSIYSQAVHSHLQLIRNKLYIADGMTVQEMIERNESFFQRVADHIKTYHDYRPGITEFMDAAEMFLSTIDSDAETIQSQPEWKSKIKN